MGLLDPPGAPLTRFKISERDKPVPVATRAAPAFDSTAGLSDGTILGGTARINHTITRSCFGVQVAFSNFYAASSTEASGLNNITVRSALEPTSGMQIPLTFGGKRDVVIEPGATVLSDIVGIDLVKGSVAMTRTYVTVTAGQKFPLGYILTGGSEGHNYANPAGADLTTSGSSTGLAGVGLNALRVFGPSAILGRPAVVGSAVVGIVGDSIANGSTDSDNGWIQRMLNNNYSFQKIATPGEGFFGFLNTFGSTRWRRMSILARAGATHLVCEYIVNSLNTTTYKVDALATWTILARMGVPMWATTCTPQTTSTDAWATVANQTVLDSTKETRRLDYNAWLRDGAPISSGAPVAVAAAGTRAGQAGHPLTGYLEVADLAESARDSGKWKASYTTDGTHPSTTGATALGAGFNPVTLFGPAAV